jgi:GT2 family glycosyltransferase
MCQLSIIIPTLNALRYLPACLVSIQRSNLSSITYEVIVIDNGSSDGTRDFLVKNLSPIPLLWRANETNTGFSAACNQGAGLASGETLLFLNPDVELDPDCLRLCRQYIRERGAVGVLGCRLRFPDGRYQKSAGSMRSFLNEIRERRIQRRLRAGDLSADRLAFCDSPQPVDWVSGTVMFVRADLFRDLGGFDTGFFAYFEDVDLCVRAAQKGREVVYYPLAGAVHISGASSANRARVRQIYRASQLRFYRKHHGGLNLLALRLYLALLGLGDWVRRDEASR